MKRRTVSVEALKRAGERSTRASARLAGREVPADHVQSEAVQRYLDDIAARRRSDDTTDTGQPET